MSAAKPQVCRVCAVTEYAEPAPATHRTPRGTLVCDGHAVFWSDTPLAGSERYRLERRDDDDGPHAPAMLAAVGVGALFSVVLVGSLLWAV